MTALLGRSSLGVSSEVTQTSMPVTHEDEIFDEVAMFMDEDVAGKSAVVRADNRGLPLAVKFPKEEEPVAAVLAEAAEHPAEFNEKSVFAVMMDGSGTAELTVVSEEIVELTDMPESEEVSGGVVQVSGGVQVSRLSWSVCPSPALLRTRPHESATTTPRHAPGAASATSKPTKL